MAKTSFHIQR